MAKIGTFILCFFMFAMVTFTPCFGGTAVNDYVLDESALDRYFKRLIEVQEELGMLGKIFEKSARRMKKGWPEHEVEKRIVEEVNRMRMPGFCAYHLAEEGIALVNLIAVKITLLREKYEQSASSTRLQRLDKMQKHAEEAAVFMFQTLEAMEPYSTLDARKIIESIARKYRSLHP